MKESNDELFDCLDSNIRIINILQKNLELLKFHCSDNYNFTFQNVLYSISRLNSSSIQLDLIKEIISDMTVLLATNGEYKCAFELTVFFDDFDSYYYLYTKIRGENFLQNTTDLPKDLLEYTRKLLLEYHPLSNKAIRFKSNLLYEYSWSLQPRDFVPSFSFRYYDEIYTNVYGSINTMNAGMHYWYFLTSNYRFIDRFREYLINPDITTDKDGFSIPNFKLRIDQLNVMKEFFDHSTTIAVFNSSFKLEDYKKPEYLRLSMLANEAYNLVYEFYQKDKENSALYSFANCSLDAFYIEMFFRQKEQNDFLLYFRQNNEELKKLVYDYYIPRNEWD